MSEDAHNFLMVPGEKQLIFLQRCVEREDVCVNTGHQLVHRLVELLDADFDRKLVDGLIGEAEHGFCEHETRFDAFRDPILLVVIDLLRDPLQNLHDVALQVTRVSFLVPV